MKQLASLLSVWSLCCCFQENLVESYTPNCGSDQMTVQGPNGTFKECLHCEHCHPGRGLYPHKCGDTVTFPVIIECKKCESGKTVSDTYDSSICRLCQLCAEHEVVSKECTPSSDTKCNKTCNSDYFFSKPQQVCKRCSYCCLDGKDEEQPQCINKGLKADNRYCSPRPDRTCNPSTPTGSVISTESKHLNKPTSQQNGKIVWILSCVVTGLLLIGLIILCYYLWRKTRNRRNGQNNVQTESNLEGRFAQFEPREDNKLTLQAPGLQEVLQNYGYDSATSTPQGHHKGITLQPALTLQAPGLREVQRNYANQSAASTPQLGNHKGTPHIADESARLSMHDNKDVEGPMADNFAGKGQSWPPEEVNISSFPDSSKNSQAGSRVEFHCTVRGCQQVLYRWFKDGQELPGEDNSTLILNPLEVRHFGFYYCEVRSDKSHELSSVDSKVVELDVTPAGGKSYRRLAEVFDSDINLKETVANLLEKETSLCRKAYRQVACHYKMRDIDRLERCRNPGEDVLDSLKSTQPDLTVHHFCKVLKGENIRRLDIVNELVAYLI